MYYMLAPEGQYYNYSGCGNTFNCNHPQVRKFILDCLRYWVLEMHVDGFRFDLASIMTRAPSVWHQDSDRASSSLHAVPGQPNPATSGHSTICAHSTFVPRPLETWKIVKFGYAQSRRPSRCCNRLLVLQYKMSACEDQTPSYFPPELGCCV